MAIWHGPPIKTVSSNVAYTVPNEPLLYMNLSSHEFRKKFMTTFPGTYIEPIFLANRFEPGALVAISNRTASFSMRGYEVPAKSQVVLMDREYGIECGIEKDLVNQIVDKSKEILLYQNVPYLFLKQEFFWALRADILSLQMTDHVINAINSTSTLFTTVHLLTDNKIAVIDFRVTGDTPGIVGAAFQIARKITGGPYR